MILFGLPDLIEIYCLLLVQRDILGVAFQNKSLL